MRRARYVVFFVSILACGLLLYWQHSRQKPKQDREAPIAGTLAAVPVPSPRLSPAVPSRSADNDNGSLVLDDHSTIQQIRDSLLSNPRLAEKLAREGRQRLPDSPEADERDALLVIALTNQGRIERARIEAHYYFDHHQNGRFAEKVSFLTRVYPRSAERGP